MFLFDILLKEVFIDIKKLFKNKGPKKFIYKIVTSGIRSSLSRFTEKSGKHSEGAQVKGVNVLHLWICI